jgi:hypothetical protein
MTLIEPYPEELLRVAKKVVWYDRPEQTLGDFEHISDALDGLWIVGGCGGG